MTNSLEKDQNDAFDQGILLSPEEEDMLAVLREILADVRARGASPELPAVKGALALLGASETEGANPTDPTTFRLREIRFSLQESTAPNGGIEVRFLCDRQ